MHPAAVTLYPLQTLLNSPHREQALPFQQATGSHDFTLPPRPYWLSEPPVPFASKHTCNRPVSLITHEVWHRLPPFFTWVSVSEICTLSFCPFLIPWYKRNPACWFKNTDPIALLPLPSLNPPVALLISKTSCQLPSTCSCHLPSKQPVFLTLLLTLTHLFFPCPCLLVLLYKRNFSFHVDVAAYILLFKCQLRWLNG